VTPEILKKLTDEYLGILEKSPSKFKSKMKTLASNGQAGVSRSLANARSSANRALFSFKINPSVNARDESVTGQNHKTPHDKQHHHHHHNRGGSTNSSSNNVRKQPVDTSVSATTSSSSTSVKQAQQNSSSASYKNQPMMQPGLSSSSSNPHLQRQRPSSSTSSQQVPYPGSSDNSASSQKPAGEDRVGHRPPPQDTSNYGNQVRPIDTHKRMSSNQAATVGMSQSQPQLTQHQPPHQKPTNHDQRHSLPAGSKAPPDYQQKSMKHLQVATGNDVHGRNSSQSSHSQPQQQQPSPHLKKSSWNQQQQQSSSQPQSNLPKPTQSHAQASHSQTSLGSSTLSSSRNSSSQSLPSYSESQKQNSSQQSSQNDFWFNDKLHETTTKPISPIRQSKSMFSPSPEHETYDKRLLMMTSHVKRHDSPKSDKQDRRSATPNKREKKVDIPVGMSQPSSQVDRKQVVPKLEATTVPQMALDPNSQMKKRPFSAIEEQMSGEFNRDSKTRKIEIKTEPNPATMKQPIETNPDIVKSLLQECFTVNKYDSFGMDSPLDVMNTSETSTSLTLLASEQVKTELNDASTVKMEPRENGFEEEHHKRNKSKKKKEKHKHKKKKSHKSDREDRDEHEGRRDSSLKMVLPVDSKSSPESHATMGKGLKIKIPFPIKDVSKSDLANAQLQLPPAPLKLKISKEKISGFSNPGIVSDGGSSSSSTHKKKEKDKDKDRSKSKSSKHGNNNNVPEYKDPGFQHHPQIPMNKVSAA
jgi:hypothetical protein